MSSAWAAVIISAIVAICGLLAVALKLSHREGAREGKIDASIELLTQIAADHEARLRKGRL